jgi:colicin import membrane protein
MTKTSKLTLAVLPLFLTLACGDANKAPAESAVSAAEKAAAALTEEINKFAPDQVKAVREALSNAKVAIAKQDFKGARALAEPLPAKVAAAVAAATVAKEAAAKEAAAAAAEAKKAFDAGAAALGKKLDAMKTQVAKLAKAKKLPKGVTKDAVKKGKEMVAALEADFAKAKAQAVADGTAALAIAKEIEAKAAELAKSLKLK